MRGERRGGAEQAFPAVLAAARQGDSDAIAALYRSYAPLVLGYLRSQRALNAEDLAADVFVSVMEKLDSFEGDETHFRSWLLTITFHRRVDDYRRTTRRPEDAGLPGEVLELRPDRAEADEAALRRIDADEVLAAVDRLTDDQREVLVLRVLADLPVLDVARITGRTESAVKALLRRAFASLHRLLPPDLAGDGHGNGPTRAPVSARSSGPYRNGPPGRSPR